MLSAASLLLRLVAKFSTWTFLSISCSLRRLRPLLPHGLTESRAQRYVLLPSWRAVLLNSSVLQGEPGLSSPSGNDWEMTPGNLSELAHLGPGRDVLALRKWKNTFFHLYCIVSALVLKELILQASGERKRKLCCLYLHLLFKKNKTKRYK